VGKVSTAYVGRKRGRKKKLGNYTATIRGKGGKKKSATFVKGVRSDVPRVEGGEKRKRELMMVFVCPNEGREKKEGVGNHPCSSRLKKGG